MKTIAIIALTVIALAVLTWLVRPLFAQQSAGTDGDKVTHADTATAAQLVAAKKVAVVDIRTPKEFAAGHIAGATNLDFYASDFEKQLGQLDKTKTWLVHCAVGGRSTRSLAAFKKLGFQSVVHLDGGFAAWEKAGKPVEK